MSLYTSDTIGAEGTDDVRLVVNGQDILIAESWDVHEGILEQPMVWSLSLGSGSTAADILGLAPKGTPFQLFVGGALQATGVTEGVTASGGGKQGTVVTIKGRDPLAELYSSSVVSAQSFTNVTYLDLTWRALLAVGLVTGATVDPAQLASSNDANRIIKTGKTVKVLIPPRPVDQVVTDTDGSTETVTQSNVLQARLGENWLHFLRRYLDTAGLTLWAAADGTFVLSEPNVNQAPLYQIIRQAGPNAQQRYGNVVSYRFQDDATHRHSFAIAYSKGGGRGLGRQVTSGEQVDDEMMAVTAWSVPLDANGIAIVGARDRRRKISFRESSAQNREQCEAFCERKLLEERREGWQLHYVVAGHTLPLFGGGQGATAVITPDTVVQVSDAELGISNQPFYIESLRRSRSPQTTTEIRLMRPQDVTMAYNGSAPGGASDAASAAYLAAYKAPSQ